MKEISNLVPSHLMADDKDMAKKAKNVMGKDDFMKLLMTQLQHQDPMKPMDHHEMGTQLAQFSSLEQLSNIGAGIQGLRTDRSGDAKLQAMQLIGKKVQAAGNQVELLEGQSVQLRPSLKEGINPAKAMIYDGGGRLVREISLADKNLSEGIQWDGKNEEGTSLPSGKYTFRVHGVDKNGQAQEIGTELSGRVTGMELRGNDAVLLVQTPSGTSKLEMNRVTAVSLDDNEAAKPAAVSVPKPAVVAAAPKPEGEEEASSPTEEVSIDMFEGRDRGFPNHAIVMEGIRR